MSGYILCGVDYDVCMFVVVILEFLFFGDGFEYVFDVVFSLGELVFVVLFN